MADSAWVGIDWRSLKAHGSLNFFDLLFFCLVLCEFGGEAADVG